MTAACPRCGAPLPSQALEVTAAAVVLAPQRDEQQGLLGWAQVRVGQLLLAGLAIRRRADGEITVTFPARKDRRGALHREVTVLDSDLRRAIRVAVIAAYIDARRRAGRGAP